MRRGIAGDLQAARLGPAHRFDALGGRQVSHVIAPACEFHQVQIAFDHDHLGFRRNAGETKAGRGFALVHDAVAGEARLLGVLNDRPPEKRGVGERAAQDQGVGEGAVAVGEADRAIFGEQAVFGQFLAGQTLGGGGVGVDIDQPDGGPGVE